MTSTSTSVEIFAQVQEILRAHLQVTEPVTPATHLYRDLALDSLKALTFVVELENKFLICFDPEDEQGLMTLADVVSLIQRRVTSENLKDMEGVP